MTKYKSTHQEKQFAGPPVFVSTFQGGLPWVNQGSSAVLRAEQQLPASVCSPCSPARPVLSYSPYPLQPLSEARSQGAGCSEDWESQTASPQCLQHSCAPDFVTDVAFPSLAEPTLHLQQPLVRNTFSAWLKPNTKWPEKLKSFSAFEVQHTAYQTRQDSPNP